MSDIEHKAKMAPRAGTPPGLETDGKGNIIPFDQRTEDDKEKTRSVIADAIHSGKSVKNPEREAQNPAPMSRERQGTDAAPKTDLAGQQGGTEGGGRG